MDFSLTPEQTLFQDEVAKFARREIAPGAQEREEKGKFSQEAWNKICDFGLSGLSIPEEFGGGGASAVDSVLTMITLVSQGKDFALEGVWATHLFLAAMPIVELGTQAQKEKYLPQMASGELIGALCLTETEAGSDATALRTTAVRDGDSYVLNGSKAFISNAPIAGVFLVFATMDRSSGAGGITMFIVDADSEGLTVGKPLNKRECDSWPTSEVFFDNCRVPIENRLGEEKKGFEYMLRSLSWERLAFGPYVGLQESVLLDSIEYSKQRVQFGKPISDFQLVKAMLAEMKIDLEASRLLVYRLAWKVDQGASIALDAAIAKTFVTEAAERSASKAVQIFGGVGCMKDHPIGQGLWLAKMATIGGGTSQLQRLIIGHMLTT